MDYIKKTNNYKKNTQNYNTSPQTHSKTNADVKYWKRHHFNC